MQRKHETWCFLHMCSVADNPVVRWYDTSCMKHFSVAYLGKIWGVFCPSRTLINVAYCKENQSPIFDISSIDPHEMQGGSS